MCINYNYYLMGDMNAQTSDKDDYIEVDFLSDFFNLMNICYITLTRYPYSNFMIFRTRE